MIRIKQFRYAVDNFSYLAYGPKESMAVDGGAFEEILSFVDRHGLTLKYVINTHCHPDHTIGNSELIQNSRARYLNHEKFARKGELKLDGFKIKVFATPGHTKDSVSFFTGSYLITGDTLFNGTVGNCFSGDLKSFYESIKMLLSHPDETVIYAGHDYVEESVSFAREVEPENPHFSYYLKKYDSHDVRSTLGDERKVNPFLRFNEPSIKALLKRKNLPCSTELERWKSVMTL